MGLHPSMEERPDELYTTLGPMLVRSGVEHQPWPLYWAVVRELEGNLLAAAGCSAGPRLTVPSTTGRCLRLPIPVNPPPACYRSNLSSEL